MTSSISAWRGLATTLMERALYTASPQPELRLFEWLARVVPRRSTQALSEELARLDYLRALGVDRYDVGLLSGERLRH